MILNVLTFYNAVINLYGQLDTSMNEINRSFIIDKSSAVPIYTQLSSWLEAKITTGEWPPDYRLPGEIELAKQLDVSRGTLRKSISQLIQKNLLVQIHGRGTFVSPFVVEQSWAGRLVGVYEELMVMGIPFVTTVLENKIIPASTKIAEELGLEPEHPVFYLKRLRQVEDKPLVIMENYLDGAKFQGLISADFSQHSIMETIENLYDLTLSWGAHTIAVIRAGAGLASNLQIKISDPVLYNESVIYDENEEKILFTKQWFRSDRYRLRTVVHRGENEAFYSAISQNKPGNVETNEKHSSKTEKTLSELLTPDRIRTNVHVNSPEEAIQSVGQLMVDSGGVKKRYINAMVNIANQLGPYIVIAPGVAVPHARPEDGVINPCLAMITLDPPIDFGNPQYDPVKIVFAIGAVDAVQHIKALRTFADFLLDGENIESLSNANTLEEILAIIRK